MASVSRLQPTRCAVGGEGVGGGDKLVVEEFDLPLSYASIRRSNSASSIVSRAIRTLQDIPSTM